jgi:Ohr subfamily peroxiredoxin
MSQPARLEKTLYTAHATATGGREGRVRSDDGTLDLPLAMPPGLGGKGGAGTNPEQLFAAGYAACFGSAAALVARQKKLAPESVTIDARVQIGTLASGGFGLAVKLEARLPGLSPEDARAVVEAAHQLCPYSNATRGNIEVDITVA